MRKARIVISISTVSIIAICVIIFSYRDTSPGLTGKDTPKEGAIRSNRDLPDGKENSMRESLDFKRVKLTAGGKPDNFTEGLWIKKYPGDNACFKFETVNGIKIVCDPYIMNETVSPDIVTESHQDADHVDTSKLTGNFRLFKQPGIFRVKRIRITGIPGQHNKRDRAVTNTIFVFEINGIKIAHFASQGQIPNDKMWKMLEEFKGIDILMIQGTTNSLFMNIKMTDGECLNVIDRLNPKIVIPEHGSSRICENFARYYGTKVDYIDIDGLIITGDNLKSIKGRRIINMDTRE